jgi:hypothetical protein
MIELYMRVCRTAYPPLYVYRGVYSQSHRATMEGPGLV